MFTKIIVNSAWYYFLLSVLLSLGFSFWLYYKNRKNKEVPSRILLGMFVLRFLSTFIIVLFLLNIFLKRTVNETENPIILFAIDNSRSMIASEDSNSVKGSFLSALGVIKKNIGQKYQIKSILFGGGSENTEKNPTFSEKETDLSNLFRSLDNNYSNQNIGALILVSDGIYNKGANPLYSAEKQNYPMYTVATGDTSEFRDVAIQKINHNRLTYSGNTFPVELVINAKKYSGKSVRVALYEQGIQKAQSTVKISSANFLSTINFTLTASKTGLNKYTARIEVLQGEKNSTNNEQSFVIEVIDSKDKILLLASSPHPDISAIKEAITNCTNYELDYSLTKDFTKAIKGYNLVILHGYTSSQNTLVTECENNRVPFWIINPSTTERLPNIKISSAGNRFNEAEPALVPTFGLFNLSAEFKIFCTELPAVKTYFGNYSLNNGAQNLLNQRIGMVETENPLLFFSESGSVKSAVFLGDGLWRWKLRDFAEHKNHNLFNELITKSLQYLTVKADKSVFRLNGPKIIEENKAIEFDAEVYNKSYESITEPEVNMVITDSERKKYNYTFSKTSNSYKLNIGLLPVGEYNYEATVKINTELYNKLGTFVVSEVIAEKLNTVANHQLLFQLAKKSNGKLFYPNQLQNLEEELLKNENIKPISYSKKSTTDLIELSWIFGLILVLFSAEWFFRKRYLTI